MSHVLNIIERSLIQGRLPYSMYKPRLDNSFVNSEILELTALKHSLPWTNGVSPSSALNFVQKKKNSYQCYFLIENVRNTIVFAAMNNLKTWFCTLEVMESFHFALHKYLPKSWNICRKAFPCWIYGVASENPGRFQKKKNILNSSSTSFKEKSKPQ